MTDSSPNPIAGYEDWPAAVRSAQPYIAVDATSTALGRVLGLRQPRDRPAVLDEGSQRLDGVVIRRLRWSVGYGPDTTSTLIPRGSEHSASQAEAAAACCSRHLIPACRRLW